MLVRLGQQGDVFKVEKPAVMGYVILGPELFHHPQHLVGAPAPGVDRYLQRVELGAGIALPADADAEVEPSPGNLIHGGHHLGQHNRVVQGGDDDAGEDAQPGGRAGRRRHCR